MNQVAYLESLISKSYLRYLAEEMLLEWDMERGEIMEGRDVTLYDEIMFEYLEDKIAGEFLLDWQVQYVWSVLGF